MACGCRDASGALLPICMGICYHAQREKQADAVQMRSEESIEDRMEYIFSSVIDRFDRRLKEVSEMIDDKYKEGFKQGFEMAKDIYE